LWSQHAEPLRAFHRRGLRHAAFADTPPGTRTITTSATATVYVKPDVARIHYGIRLTEPSPDAIKDIMAKTVKTMDEAIAKLKLKNMTITTAPISIRQQGANGIAALAGGGAVGGAPGMGAMQPYVGQTSNTATITESDPEKLRAAVDAFVKAVAETGCNSSGSEEAANPFAGISGQEQGGGPKVVLSRSDDSDTRAEALQKATEKALRQAKALAKGLGGAEVKVISVTDGEVETAPTMNLNSIFGDMKPDGPRTPAGEVEVKVRVTVKVSY
jgi:uncharacterized protein YggE